MASGINSKDSNWRSVHYYCEQFYFRKMGGFIKKENEIAGNIVFENLASLIGFSHLLELFLSRIHL